MTTVALAILVFVFGACIGSFLNVVIYRLPRGESIVVPPSHCPQCGRGIAWYDNIPIASWLILRGRCRHCGVRISPQYILVELATGLMVLGLFLCYFVWKVRSDGIAPADLDPVNPAVWPMFVAHAAMLCGLLACSAVDVRFYMVPLPVMWVVALAGAAAAVVAPHPFLPTASPTLTAMSLAAGLGIILSLLALRWGYLRPSFIDASNRPLAEPVPAREEPRPERSRRKRKRRRGKDRDEAKPARTPPPPVGITAQFGVNPRREMLHECLFLLPAFVLAAAVWALLHFLPAAQAWWACWFDPHHHPQLAPRLAGAGGAVLGFLVGGLWIWATRILGTLVAGREAMGLGDVHILAGVGAVAGWAVASLTFFIAPVSGLAMALFLAITRRMRELPYGPWLAVGTVGAILAYDPIVRYIGPGLTVIFMGR